MKKLHSVLLLASVAFLPCMQAQTLKTDSIEMGAGYANQIYYDMATGQKGSASMTNWDIAHTTDPRGACIRANHMAGVMVFSYPKSGISGWSSFDTTGWKSFRKRYNDLHNHDFGAFSLYASHPKYDWATYSVNHELIGDSIYLLAWTTNGVTFTKFQKFWPVIQPTTTDLIFKYANVDGSNEVSDTLYQSAANNQNYKYYTFGSKAKNVREPNKTTWDISFTRYYEPQYNPMSGKFEPYPTMGVESNRGTKVARIIGPTFATVLADSHDLVRKNYPVNFKNDLTAIGSNWKVFNQTTFKYEYKDTQSYIIKSVRADTSYWLIHFTKFGGSSNGRVVFNYLKLRGNNVSVNDLAFGTVNVFPNPAKNNIYVTLDETKVSDVAISVYSLNGSLIKSTSVKANNGFQSVQIPVSDLSAGIYMLTLQSGDKKLSQKIVIE